MRQSSVVTKGKRMKCVVLIPGIMGSSLRNAEGSVWPPTVWEVITGYGRISDLLAPDLEVVGIIRKVGPTSVYSSLLDDIYRCGYAPGSSERLFIPFPYDWRQSNADSAGRLGEVLDNTFADGVDDLEITLVAHSMGGLVSRYLLESGHFDTRPWFAKIARLVTLGTPHHGAPLAIKRLAGEEGTLGISGQDVKLMGNDPRYPSLFQLVGYSGNGLVANRGAYGEIPRTVDPFEDRIQQALGMNPHNVASARQFWETIHAGKRPAHVGYYCIASSSLNTIVRAELRGQDSTPISIERKDGGDGTVPFASAVLAGLPNGFSRKKHSAIFEDRDVRRQLYRILDAPATAVPQSADTSVAFAAEDAIGLSVGKDSYSAGEPIELVVSYSTPVQDPREFFSVTRLDPETEQLDASFQPREIESRLSGTDIGSFSLTISNDFDPGLYRIEPSRSVDDPSETYFFVTEANANH